MSVVTEVSTVEKTVLKKPSKYNVILHNDDVTPFDYVMLILINIFEKTVEEAHDITTQIHVSKGGIAGTYSKEIAEQKVEEIKHMNNNYSFALVASIEKE